jgi:hypothetical protein
MNDPESAFRLISTELARRRAPALRRASLEWDAGFTESSLPRLRGMVGVGAQQDGCVSGDYNDAA